MNPVLWFLGNSGSGKSTITDIVIRKYPQFHVIDNDAFRKKYPKSFTREMRMKTCEDLLSLAKEESKKYPVIVNKITPYEEVRANNRKTLGTYYHEIYCRCPIEILVKRDVKGLYKKALNNELEHLIGISDHPDDVFETPLHSNLILDTGNKTIEEITKEMFNYIDRYVLV